MMAEMKMQVYSQRKTGEVNSCQIREVDFGNCILWGELMETEGNWVLKLHDRSDEKKNQITAPLSA